MFRAPKLPYRGPQVRSSSAIDLDPDVKRGLVGLQPAGAQDPAYLQTYGLGTDYCKPSRNPSQIGHHVSSRCQSSVDRSSRMSIRLLACHGMLYSQLIRLGRRRGEMDQARQVRPPTAASPIASFATQRTDLQPRTESSTRTPEERYEHGKLQSVAHGPREATLTELASLRSSRRTLVGIPSLFRAPLRCGSRLTDLTSLGPEIILQKQYRPPIDKVTIEVPAGLVDEGETAEQAAVRELKEETGYVGKVTESTPVMFNG